MNSLRLRHLGRLDYVSVWQAMQQFSARRDDLSLDEIWLVEHAPVFTQGLNGKREHVLALGDIPLVAVDRGGQVTYHGPGQLVVYLLVDIARRGLGVRDLVSQMEQAVVAVLGECGIEAQARADAPGVYVGAAKIASLGLRVRRGRSYHGLSLNVDMDLEPFSRINPCGYPGMAVTSLAQLGMALTVDQVSDRLVRYLSESLAAEVTEVAAALPTNEMK